MEKKRRQDSSHWTTPGVFYGEVEAIDAVQRVTDLPRQAEWSGPVSLPVVQTDKAVEMAELTAEIATLKSSLDQLEERLKTVQIEHRRERERLYQMVLLLKQEWERARDEYRHR